MSSLYVLNPRKEACAIVFEDRNGKGQTLPIPVTWVPIDLTLSAPKDVLEDAPSFRRAKALNLIKVISDKEAQEILRKPGASDELARILSYGSSIVSDKLEAGEFVNVEIDTSEEELTFAAFEDETRDEASLVNQFQLLKNTGGMTESLAKKIAELAADKKWDNLFMLADQEIPK